MMIILFNKFQETLQEHCLLLFTPISIAMVNDEAVECRKKASDCLNVMVCRLKDTPQLSKLFDVAFTLMKSDRVRKLFFEHCSSIRLF